MINGVWESGDEYQNALASSFQGQPLAPMSQKDIMDTALTKQARKERALAGDPGAMIDYMKNYGEMPNGSPIAPQFKSLIDSSTGLLGKQYQTTWNPGGEDPFGIEAFRKKATGVGPSAWATEATKAQGLEEQGLKNATQQQGASAEAQGRSALASKYGLSPAAQARLAQTNMRAQMTGLQNVGFQGAKARAGINVQDEATKNQFLKDLPQVTQQGRQAEVTNQQWNIQNALKEKENKDRFDMGKYQEQMKSWAAGKSADSMASSGGGGKK